MQEIIRGTVKRLNEERGEWEASLLETLKEGDKFNCFEKDGTVAMCNGKAYKYYLVTKEPYWYEDVYHGKMLTMGIKSVI